MGRVKDKLIELEDAEVIEWNNELRHYVLVADLPEPKPFDLAEYLFHLHRNEAE